MANPRQRRKQRSSTHRAVQHAKHAKKNMKKMKPLRAPKILQDAWDPHLTVKQNYAALGLLPTLNPRAKGGADEKHGPLPTVTLLPTDGQPESLQEELIENTHVTNGDDDVVGHEKHSTSKLKSSASAKPSRTTKGQESNSEGGKRQQGQRQGQRQVQDNGNDKSAIGPGRGRIIRDKDGNVVDVELCEEDERGLVDNQGDEEMEVDRNSTPWGQPMEEWGVPIGSGVNGSAPAKTGIVKALEEFSTKRILANSKIKKHLSAGEVSWLHNLVRIHGNDFGRAARDRKNNPWQKTEGEIRRAVFKLGGVEKMLRTE